MNRIYKYIYISAGMKLNFKKKILRFLPIPGGIEVD